MTTHGVLSHLATKFSAHPENVATEGLGYVLQRSEVARDALREFIRGIVRSELPASLSWRNQGADASLRIPDLVGSDVSGNEVVLVEAKFWAGLTENQPVGYLLRLPEGPGRLVLVVAPEARFETLWPELRGRCREAGQVPGETETPLPGTKCARVGSGRLLAMASWRALLGALRRAAEGRDEAAVADLRQLEGMAERIDQDAFLPLRAEELCGEIPRRVIQFCDLVDTATERLERREELVSTKKLRSAGAHGWYGRYMNIRGFLGLLHFSAELWMKRGHSPIWFLVSDSDYRVPPALREALVPLGTLDPPRLYEDDYGLVIPILLPVGVEREDVVAAIVRQVAELHGLLASAAVPGDPQLPDGVKASGAGK